MSTKTLMTVEQFAQMRTGDTEDYELVDGELIPLSSGTPRHNLIRDLLGHLLWLYFTKNPIGQAMNETDCQVTSEVVRRPDVLIFLGARVTQADMDRIPIPFVPDIAVDVLSPSETAIGLRKKVREYLKAGAKEVWLIDQANAEVVIHGIPAVRILEASGTLESPLLPGFAPSIAELLGGFTQQIPAV